MSKSRYKGTRGHSPAREMPTEWIQDILCAHAPAPPKIREIRARAAPQSESRLPTTTQNSVAITKTSGSESTQIPPVQHIYQTSHRSKEKISDSEVIKGPFDATRLDILDKDVRRYNDLHSNPDVRYNVGAFFDENAARFVEDLLKRKVPNWKSMNVTELVTLLKKTLTGQGKDTQTDGPTRLMSQIIALKPPFRMFAADLETTRAWVNSVAKLVDTKTDGYDASRWTQEMNESFFTTFLYMDGHSEQAR
jgi:hypothetical protein